MKRLITILLALGLLLPAPMSAQRSKRAKAPVRKTTAKRRPPVRQATKKAEAEEPKDSELFLQMLPATQQVVVADSVVVPLAEVLAAIPVNPEDGRLYTSSEFFRDKSQGNVCINQLGNHIIFSRKETNGRMRLYTSDLIGNDWSKPTPLKNLDAFLQCDYPYLMADGVTLYFAAQAADNLGGYDIYRTRFDAATASCKTPENLGLPFNSEQDDFLYVIDEQYQLAYFASTRRQAPGQVCVYTFIPTNSRQAYDPLAVGEDKLRSLALLEHIADTWGKGQEHQQALARMEEKRQALDHHPTASAQAIPPFVINDRTTYTRLSDFKHPEDVKRLLELRRQIDDLDKRLQHSRDAYSQAKPAERKKMAPAIVDDEQRLDELRQAARLLEKTIRNQENE